MRKTVMGLGGFLIVVGIVVLVMSLVSVGGITAQVDEIDAVIADATGSVSEVGAALEDTAAQLDGIDTALAEVEEPVSEFAGTLAALKDTADEWFADGDLELTAGDLDGIAVMVEGTGMDASWFRDQATYLRQEGLAWAVTGEDVSNALDPIIETLDAASGGISEAQGVISTAQAGLRDFAASVDDMAAGIEEMDIGGMVGEVVGFLQMYLILSSIMFIAGGAGLLLVGMRKE